MISAESMDEVFHFQHADRREYSLNRRLDLCDNVIDGGCFEADLIENFLLEFVQS